VKKNAKQRMKKRKAKYLVGYLRDGNAVFGREFGRRGNIGLGNDGGIKLTDPMNRRQAKKLLADMPCDGCAIFELVPVEVNR
jgi:hypothetical protein